MYEFMKIVVVEFVFALIAVLIFWSIMDSVRTFFRWIRKKRKQRKDKTETEK